MGLLLCMHVYKELMHVLKPIKRQDLLENGKKWPQIAFPTGAKILFREKNILGLGAL